MNHSTFAWNHSRYQLRQRESWREICCWAGLFLAALLLFSYNLGSLPLVKGTEEILAQIAQQIKPVSLPSGGWIFPLLEDDAYRQYPPLVPTAIAIAYTWGGTSEWTTRLPSALLAAASVPLLYSLAREMLGTRLPSLLAALLYLTLVPVVRYGRMAAPHGALLFFAILLMLCVLRSRRDLRWSLGAGLSLSGLLLTHPLVGCLLAIVALIFLGWDTPRLLTSVYFWLGVTLGVVPAITGYGEQWQYDGQRFAREMLLAPLQNARQQFPGLRGFYTLEMLKYTWPGLIFAFCGLRLAWQAPIWSWAKLIFIWGGLYLLVISVLPVEQIELLLPLYPPLALAGGIALAEAHYSPHVTSDFKLWTGVLLGLSVLLSLMGLSLWLNYPLDWRDLPQRSLTILNLFSVAFTFLVTAVLTWRRNPQFSAVLFWGMYVSLLLFVNSPYWLVTTNIS